MSPINAAGHITMAVWDSIEDCEAWRDGDAFDRAHDDSSPDQAFERPNEVEIHEVIVHRDPTDTTAESATS
ncbi:MAG: hypothetical protein ABEJ57_03890 [Halobacteriaceae archaeon]